MPHLTEKLAEFIFKELSTEEMHAAQRHLAACSSCRQEVEQFQRMHWMLRASSPDTEPPRRLIFEFEKHGGMAWIWRWLAPMAASAAVALAIVYFGSPVQPPPQVVDRRLEQPVPAVQPVDYPKMMDELRAADRQWLENELKKRDLLRTRELERLRGDVAALDNYQRRIEREMWENARDVQLLAAKTDARE